MPLVRVPIATPNASGGEPGELVQDAVQGIATAVRQHGLHSVSVEGSTVRLARTDVARGWAWWNPLAAVQRGTIEVSVRDGEVVMEPNLELDGLQRWPASWSFLLPLPLLLVTDSAREAIPFYAMGYAVLALLRPVAARVLLPRSLRELLQPPGPSGVG